VSDDPVRVAHEALKLVAAKRRKKGQAEHGILSQSITEVMRLVDEQKAAGTSKEWQLKTIERTLRAAWPQTRAWKFLCETCSDCGLEIRECPGDATCGRSKAHLAHEFGVPCLCPAGARFRPKPKPTPDDFTQAAKTAKPKGLTRFGR
jgi:hypothetical protein